MICCNLFYGDLRQSDIHLKAIHCVFGKGCPSGSCKKKFLLRTAFEWTQRVGDPRGTLMEHLTHDVVRVVT